MEPNETMVNDLDDLDISDLEIPEEVVEEEPDDSLSLDSLMEEEQTEESGEEPGEEPPQEEPKAKEPGWVKKRVEKAVTKAVADAVAETEKRMQAKFDQQMAPLRERMMEEQAQDLVRSRKIADIEIAREFVRMQNGQPAAQPAVEQKSEQPVNANVQNTAKQDESTNVRVSMLDHQAKRIMAKTGIDVTQEFMNNPEIKAKVRSGEMDFYDVAEYIQQQPKKKRPPSPMRSPNGASGVSPNAIENMTDEQFARMERNIDKGARYELR